MKRNARPTHTRRQPARPFTLVELIVAMAVFSVLMLVMFQFFGTAQSAWRTSDANTRIYENARIAFEVIKRDLRSAVASDRFGEEIPFTVGATSDKLSFVSCVPATQDAKSELCEIHYALNGSSLLRDRECDSGSHWNFFGKKDSSWVDTPTASDELIPGVVSLSFVCFLETPDATTDTKGKVNAGTTLNRRPMAVNVTMTLVDEKLDAATQGMAQATRDKLLNPTKRSFTRTFYIN